MKNNLFKTAAAVVLPFAMLFSACSDNNAAQTGTTGSLENTVSESTAETEAEISSVSDVFNGREWNSAEELLSMMTLEEKIGQMIQAERQDIKGDDITEYFLGSVLSGGGSAPITNTPAGWSKMVDEYMEKSLKTRLQIPLIYGIDAVHGNNNVKNATMLPHNINLGAIAAGDLEKGKEAAAKAGNITAEEMLATGIRWTFAPVLGVPEDIRWGRTYEGYGENVDLVATLGTAFITALQGDLQNGRYRAAACMKHYLGEGQTTNGQNQGNAVMTDEEIRRILPPYEEAVKAGALTLMPSFSSVNGLKMHQHKELLTDVLKNELGFEGLVVSDWAALTQLTGSTYKEQIANGVNAGIDMIMATNQGRNGWIEVWNLLKECAEDGTVPIERIDDAVLRILRVKEKIGLFDNPYSEGAGSIRTEISRETAKNIAADSLVLLKNDDGIISKIKDFDNILIAGQGGNDIGMMCGGWTIQWQGSHGFTTDGVTIKQGFEEQGKNITYSKEGESSGEYDCVIAVIGESPYAETEGDRSGDIKLRSEDNAMLKKVYELGCPVVVVMLSGRPMTVSGEIDNWDGFVTAFLPGSEGGAAIAEMLCTERDFVGRTPYTWTVKTGGDVLFEYGYGLSK